jgi:hypothetical protein
MTVRDSDVEWMKKRLVKATNHGLYVVFEETMSSSPRGVRDLRRCGGEGQGPGGTRLLQGYELALEWLFSW